MEIEKLYVYPIKSMRAVSVDKATLTRYGFPYDRIFMMLQVTEENGAPAFKNVSIAPNNISIRFWQEIDYDKETLKVTYKPADGSDAKPIEISLAPDTSNLKTIEVLMHKSPTQAYQMDDKVNEWLSSCLGFDAILAYIGDHKREVRMSSLGYKSFTPTNTDGNANGWLSSISSVASKASGMILGSGEEKPSEIRFADVAPYLVASSKSMDDVVKRLPDGEQYDIVKFRPNIVVSGASAVWEEDFWGQLTIGGKSKLECEHNCGRCRSINIDYETGEQGTGEAGSMLKKLSKDRRVDAGTKWSPIFGRYSFLSPEFEGNEIRVGDEVVVSKKNTEHTAFGTYIPNSSNHDANVDLLQIGKGCQLCQEGGEADRDIWIWTFWFCRGLVVHSAWARQSLRIPFISRFPCGAMFPHGLYKVVTRPTECDDI
jgi:uncharacterized protein YcbX